MYYNGGDIFGIKAQSVQHNFIFLNTYFIHRWREAFSLKWYNFKQTQRNCISVSFTPAT